MDALAQPRELIELQRIVKISDAAMQTAVESAKGSGKPVAEMLVQAGVVSRADYIEALHHTGKAVAVTRMPDMPLFDSAPFVGGADGAAMAITDSQDTRRRFFLVIDKNAPTSRGMAAIAHAAKQGLTLAGRITVEPAFLRVVAASRSGAVAEAVGRSHRNESQLHTDFDDLGRTALKARASDIHITLRDGRGEVKMRVDGELEHFADWDEDYTVAFCSAVYNTMTEGGSTREGFSRTMRQDGAIERVFPEGLVRFRYASAPIAPSGIDVTMRLIPLGVDRRHRSMGELGYSRDQQDDLDRMFAHSSGLIFFLGVTGSGKSTSMAVALENLARAKPGKKIRTVEQPVEYRIDGAYQTSVSRDEFLPMISQMMRMDPDYIMVGETRDSETAQAVLQGARSGHLCVSTLHADGAPLAYDRLQGLGVSRHDLASVGLVVGLVYQKLVPLACPKCKQSAESYIAQADHDAALVERVMRVNGGMLGRVFFVRKGGCEYCNGRGVRGRTVCAEILRPTIPMLSSIASGDSRGLWQGWRNIIDTNRPDVMRGRTAFEHALHKMRLGLLAPSSIENEFKLLDEMVFNEGGFGA